MNVHKLLDHGWRVTLYKGGMGSYVAVAEKPGSRPVLCDMFDADKALASIADKVLGLGMYTPEVVQKLKDLGAYYFDDDDDAESWKDGGA